MKPNLEELLRLAGAIADDGHVDWDAETEARPDMGAALTRLRAVHKLAIATRGLIVSTRSGASVAPPGSTDSAASPESMSPAPVLVRIETTPSAMPSQWGSLR